MELQTSSYKYSFLSKLCLEYISAAGKQSNYFYNECCTSCNLLSSYNKITTSCRARWDYSMYISSLIHSIHVYTHFHISLAVCSNAEIRLAGGPSNLAGRLEICFNNQWGTVCAGNTWTESDAKVVCRQLGHSTTGNLY